MPTERATDIDVIGDGSSPSGGSILAYDRQDAMSLDEDEDGDEDEADLAAYNEDLKGPKAHANKQGGKGHRWQVDHSTGEYKFRARRFIRKVLNDSFGYEEALRMLQTKQTINFGSRCDGGRPARLTDDFYPQFYLDFHSIVGKPGRPITKRDALFFDNITVSFARWSAPYGAKHVGGINFDLTGRTFRIAHAASREVWFIVMHPLCGEVSELPWSAADRRRKLDEAAGKSGMSAPLGRELVSYIVDVFKAGFLVGEGVESSWQLGGKSSQQITLANWFAFQELFMAGWEEWAGRHAPDSFWRRHEPAFHAYDYGANIKIDINHLLYDMPREKPVSRGGCEDSDDDDDDDDNENDGGGVDSGGDEGNESGNEGVDDSGDEGADSQSDGDTDGEQQGNPSDGRRSSGRRGGTGNDASSGDANDPYKPMIDASDGLRKMIAELDARFELKNIAAMSYALAVCINSEVSDASGELQPRCLIVDRNAIAGEYPNHRDYVFYPQAFHPAYGNVSSSTPPAFLRALCADMRRNISSRNEGADVLSFGYFQGYSNIKRSVRHSANDLLPTKGYATAAFTVPAGDANAAALSRDRRTRLLRIVRGKNTPENPDSSKPFARERQQVEIALAQDEFAYRLEQVVSVNVAHMTSKERTFSAVISPVFQLMRFFLVDTELFIHIFRSLSPKVFPRILCAYARLFEVAIAEMDRRFVQGGERGLDLANSEGVALLDRLGGYCFTGFDRYLPKTLLRPLGTVDSMRYGAWPYIDPLILDIASVRGLACKAVIDLRKWPRTKDGGKPLLLHVLELRYHYGDRIASNRENELWFKLMGHSAFRNRGAVVDFVDELVRKLWLPQTKSFITAQLQRRLRRGWPGGQGGRDWEDGVRDGAQNGVRDSSEDGRESGGGVDGKPITSEQIDECEAAIQAWNESKLPFSNAALDLLAQGLKPCGGKMAIGMTKTRTRQDFAASVMKAIGNEKGNEKGWLAIAPQNATWHTKLQQGVTYARTARSVVDANDWASILTGCLLAAGVDWMPDSFRSRLTAWHVVRLHGAGGVGRMLGAPGSLLREAEEANAEQRKRAELRARKAKGATIDFGCSFPFQDIPPLIREGFAQMQRLFREKGDSKVLDHYHMVMTCLAVNIGEQACQLMLLLVLTVCSSSATPVVDPKTREFTVAAKRKDPAQLGLVMVTKMLWHLDPPSFPWKKGSGRTAHEVSEMSKKIEHKGCNNRMLCELGWTTAKGNRDNPHNADLKIQSPDKMETQLLKLKAAMKRPEDFIAMVFRSDDDIWAERCSSIINRR